MKNRNVLLIMMLVLTTHVFAQDRISFGVRGGLNYSTISGDPNPDAPDHTQKDQSPKVNFNLGIDAKLQLNNNKMALQGELYYSGEGFKGSESYEVLTDYTRKFGFLNLPIFFKYTFAKNFYVIGGPQFSYLLSAKEEYTIYGNGNYIYDEGTHDVSHQMNKLNLGITTAIGYEIKKVNISLRYCAGLTQLIKSEYEGKIKSQVFSFVLGYKVFGIKK